jgi:hypothetical protein
MTSPWWASWYMVTIISSYAVHCRNREVALALVRHWSLIQVGATTPPSLNRWRIVSREFRDNLKWVVVVPGDGMMSPTVRALLEELSARGITIHDSQFELW